VNASQSTLLRVLRGLGYVTLLLAVFEACSGDEASTPLPPPGPASVEITGIALGQGFVGNDGASSSLACDYTIGVNVQMTNWTLFPPGKCSGTLQCGQLRVTLLDSSVAPITVTSAGNGVSLDVRSLLASVPPSRLFDYTIRVELVDDLGNPYVALDAGNGAAEKEFQMALPRPEDCTTAGGSGGSSGGGGLSGGGGSSGTSTAGLGGDSAGEDSAGAAGIAGSAATAAAAGV